MNKWFLYLVSACDISHHQGVGKQNPDHPHINIGQLLLVIQIMTIPPRTCQHSTKLKNLFES